MIREFLNDSKTAIIVILSVILILVIGSALSQRLDELRGYGVEERG